MELLTGERTAIFVAAIGPLFLSNPEPFSRENSQCLTIMPKKA
jgi:hypothetical protein